MPNHLHGIFEIVGTDLCVNPKKMEAQNQGEGGHIGQGGHTGPPLQEIIQWFKTMTTNEYIQKVKSGVYPNFEKRLWQRNYYEYIIRNQQEYDQIREYIDTNPL